MKKDAKFLVCLILILWLPYFMGAFDKDKPAATTSLRSSNPEMLANQSQLQTAINNEHIFSGTAAGTQTGDHTQGSARCFSQAAAPATRIDGAGFLSTDLGSLWVDTDDNAVYVLTATAPTWTPFSTEIIATLLASARVFGDTLGATGDFAVNTNKFTVTAASGNTLVAGTLDVTGNIDPTTYETTNGGFLDEDAMGSDAADKVASQQSIKAYVDTQVATKGGFTTGTLTLSAQGVSVANTFEDLDISGAGGPGANAALVYLEVKITTRASAGRIWVKPKGFGGTALNHIGSSDDNGSVGDTRFPAVDHFTYLFVVTDSSGVIQWAADSTSSRFTIKVLGFVL